MSLGSIAVGAERASAPLFGFPPLPTDRMRIAYWGDPWLGAMLARRHHVFWLRPEEAHHVIELEQPHMLLVTPRVEAMRALRARPLVAADSAELDPSLLEVVSKFRDANLPIVFHDLLGESELERFLPAARLADVILPSSPSAVEAFASTGLTTARFRETGAFGSSEAEVPIIRERRVEHLQTVEMRSARTVRIRDGLEHRAGLGIETLDPSRDPARAHRVGLEIVRRAAWGVREATPPALLTMAAGSAQHLPPQAFDAVLCGTLPAVVRRGSDTALDYPHWVPAFTSLEDAVRAIRGLEATEQVARLRVALIAVLQSALSDDWLGEALLAAGGTPVAPGAWADDTHVIVATNESEDAATRFRSFDGVASSSREWPSGDDLTQRPVIRVWSANSFDEDAVRLLRGWARYSGACTTVLRDVEGRPIASWHREAATASRAGEISIKQNVLLSAERGKS